MDRMFVFKDSSGNLNRTQCCKSGSGSGTSSQAIPRRAGVIADSSRVKSTFDCRNRCSSTSRWRSVLCTVNRWTLPSGGCSRPIRWCSRLYKHWFGFHTRQMISEDERRGWVIICFLIWNCHALMYFFDVHRNKWVFDSQSIIFLTGSNWSHNIGCYLVFRCTRWKRWQRYQDPVLLSSIQ